MSWTDKEEKLSEQDLKVNFLMAIETAYLETLFEHDKDTTLDDLKTMLLSSGSRKREVKDQTSEGQVIVVDIKSGIKLEERKSR